MNTVPQQTLDFLSVSAPFDGLEPSARLALASKLTLIYLSKENSDEMIQQHADVLFLISSGQFTVKDSDGAEKNLSEGDFFNCAHVVQDTPHPICVTVDQAGLVYCIPKKVVQTLIDENPKIAHFFQHYVTEKIHDDTTGDSKSMWLYRPVSEVIAGTPVCCHRDISIFSAVKKMADEKVSSLMITEDERLVGIITDRDIRTRVVAKRLDLERPVSEVMTQNPKYITPNRTLFDALCFMTESNIHHLPVADVTHATPVGMLTASDMIRHQRGNVLFLIDELAKAKSLYELTRLSWQLPHYFAQHAKRLGDFDIAGKVLSQATDIMTRRLITFFQQQFGSPPIDFCWLVYGSQAREDQTMGSDQDNGMVLAREPNEIESEYFSKMSDYVCQGLGKCGIKLCDGNIMASNPALRLPISEAINEAKSWSLQPTKDAIMSFSIFLDVRMVAGNRALFNKMQSQRLAHLKRPLLLAALARHTNEVEVPLSLFQKFVFSKRAKKDRCIDLKVDAVAIINNIVRIYALSEGITVPSTLSRLTHLAGSPLLVEQDNHSLRDIWLFLNRLRWRHQLSNKATDNFICIDDLSSMEKHQLKAAFKFIKQAQSALVMKFSGGLG